MGSYLKLKGVTPDLILSSCALRAQQSADGIAARIGYKSKIHYLNELYLTSVETLMEILTAQESDLDSIVIMTHNPHITDLANFLMDESLSKVPTAGVVALELDINKWSELQEGCAKMEFFVYPNQFKYFMPKKMKELLLSNK